MHGPGAAVVGDGLVPSRSCGLHDSGTGDHKGRPYICRISRERIWSMPGAVLRPEGGKAARSPGIVIFEVRRALLDEPFGLRHDAQAHAPDDQDSLQHSPVLPLADPISSRSSMRVSVTVRRHFRSRVPSAANPAGTGDVAPR